MDDAIKFWISHGADGIFLDGLEIFDVNVWVAQKISYWHGLLDRYSSKGLEPSHPRILMTSYKFAKGQLISKGHFGFFNSPIKRTKIFCSTRLGQKFEFSISFLGRIGDTKKTFRN